MLQLLAERLLLGDELIHFGENVTVLVHQSSVPDYGVRRGWRYEQETRNRFSRWPRTC
jgi:hypothetical protein